MLVSFAAKAQHTVGSRFKYGNPEFWYEIIDDNSVMLWGHSYEWNNMTYYESALEIGQSLEGAFEIPSSVSYTYGDETKTYDVTKIGEYSFYNLAITAVTIPSTVTVIDDNAFYRCGINLTSVEIPASVKSIGNGAFSYSNITSITIPGTVESWGLDVFTNSKLETATITSDVTEIPSSFFSNANYLEEIVFENGCQIEKIGANAFMNCTSLKSIEIPASVKTIGSNAFDGCRNLSSVTFADNSSLKSIGASAFNNNYKLTSITLPNSVEEINNKAFYNSNLENIVLSTSIKKIGEECFKNSELTSVTIPASIQTLGNDAFSNTKLTSVTFNDGFSLEELSSGLFLGSKLTTITIPASVKRFVGNTFNDCSNLTTVYFEAPENIIEIGESTFEDCSSLFKFPLNTLTNLEEIGKKAFYLTSNEDEEESYEFPSKVTVIPDNAFDGRNITSVTFSGNVTEIGADAFAYSGLTSVTLPASIQYIGNNAFNHLRDAATSSFTLNCEAISAPKLGGNEVFDSDIPEANRTLNIGQNGLNAACSVGYSTERWKNYFTNSTSSITIEEGKIPTDFKNYTTKIYDTKSFIDNINYSFDVSEDCSMEITRVNFLEDNHANSNVSDSKQLSIQYNISINGCETSENNVMFLESITGKITPYLINKNNLEEKIVAINWSLLKKKEKVYDGSKYCEGNPDNEITNSNGSVAICFFPGDTVLLNVNGIYYKDNETENTYGDVKRGENNEVASQIIKLFINNLTTVGNLDFAEPFDPDNPTATRDDYKKNNPLATFDDGLITPIFLGEDELPDYNTFNSNVSLTTTKPHDGESLMAEGTITHEVRGEVVDFSFKAYYCDGAGNKMSSVGIYNNILVEYLNINYESDPVIYNNVQGTIETKGITSNETAPGAKMILKDLKGISGTITCTATNATGNTQESGITIIKEDEDDNYYLAIGDEVTPNQTYTVTILQDGAEIGKIINLAVNTYDFIKTDFDRPCDIIYGFNGGENSYLYYDKTMVTLSVDDEKGTFLTHPFVFSSIEVTDENGDKTTGTVNNTNNTAKYTFQLPGDKERLTYTLTVTLTDKDGNKYTTKLDDYNVLKPCYTAKATFGETEKSFDFMFLAKALNDESYKDKETKQYPKKVVVTQNTENGYLSENEENGDYLINIGNWNVAAYELTLTDAPLYLRTANIYCQDVTINSITPSSSLTINHNVNNDIASTLTIKGGTYKELRIYGANGANETSKTVISGGNFNDYTTLSIGEFEITGGTFNYQGSSTLPALSVEKDYNGKVTKVSITGGTFSGESGAIVNEITGNLLDDGYQFYQSGSPIEEKYQSSYLVDDSGNRVTNVSVGRKRYSITLPADWEVIDENGNAIENPTAPEGATVIIRYKGSQVVKKVEVETD